jgi:hypothetical protein
MSDLLNDMYSFAERDLKKTSTTYKTTGGRNYSDNLAVTTAVQKLQQLYSIQNRPSQN